MTEEQQRLAGTIIAAVTSAGMLAFAIAAYRLVRSTFREWGEDSRAFYKQMSERADHAMWAAEVDAAREAPGESA